MTIYLRENTVCVALINKYFSNLSEYDKSVLSQRVIQITDDIIKNSSYVNNSNREDIYNRLLEKRLRLIKFYHADKRNSFNYLNNKWRSLLLKSIYFNTSTDAVSNVDNFISDFFYQSIKRFKDRYYADKTTTIDAEMLAFAELYAQTNIRTKSGRYLLIKMRYNTFCLKNSKCVEDSIAFDEISEIETNDNAQLAILAEINKKHSYSENETTKLFNKYVYDKFLDYLRILPSNENCVKYLRLYVEKEIGTPEITKILRLTHRQGDRLQQKIRYHAIKFASRVEWQLIHDWLSIPISTLGLSRDKWLLLMGELSEKDLEILRLRSIGESADAITSRLKISTFKIDVAWERILIKAAELRNS